MIQMQSRLKIVIGQELARCGPERNSERIEARFLDGQPGSHFVSAELFEMRSATRKSFDERQTRDAAAASLPQSRGIEGDQDCRSMIFSREPRRHDAKHARVPVP